MFSSKRNLSRLLSRVSSWEKPWEKFVASIQAHTKGERYAAAMRQDWENERCELQGSTLLGGSCSFKVTCVAQAWEDALSRRKLSHQFSFTVTITISKEWTWNGCPLISEGKNTNGVLTVFPTMSYRKQFFKLICAMVEKYLNKKEMN